MHRVILIAIALFSLVFVASCESKIDQLIPQAELAGAVSEINLNLKKQTGKYVSGGYLWEAFGAVPFDITREQLRPTLLAAVKKIKQDHPDCEWIVVWLRPGEGLDRTSIYAGKAEYKEGELELEYSIPTDKQIEEWNSQIGKTITDPDSGTSYTVDEPRLYRPDRKTFETGKKVVALHAIVYKERADKALKENRYMAFLEADKNTDEKIFKVIAGEIGISKDKARELYRYMHKYYGPLSTRGTETIKSK